LLRLGLLRFALIAACHRFEAGFDVRDVGIEFALPQRELLGGERLRALAEAPASQARNLEGELLDACGLLLDERLAVNELLALSSQLLLQRFEFVDGGCRCTRSHTSDNAPEHGALTAEMMC
jgi:hypothetical protein